ncbi:acyl-CoA dehydrogenase family protein [Bdellovibrionota bacterium FG-1]
MMTQLTDLPHSPEILEIRALARQILSKELKPRVEHSETTGEFCREALIQLGQAGLAAPMLPEPWGSGELADEEGATHGLLTQLIVAEEMGYISSGFGLSELASVCLFGANVGRQGSREQMERYLPGIASGEKIGCWALTEPAVGSDAVSVKTRCERQGDHYVLNGSKTFITNAPIADYFMVIAREYGADGKPVEGFQGGTAFILDRGLEGLKTGNPFHKMGHWSSPTGEVFMDNVRVPASQVLGKPGKAFLGMKVSLDVERTIFSGLGVGLMQFCQDTLIRYGATRKQFGVSILEHQMIQDKVARIAASLDMVRHYQYMVVTKLARGQSANKEAAILKFMGGRMANEVAAEAVQALGGYGYMREYGVERAMRDAKLYEIGGGTSEIQKLIIAKQVIKETLQ